MNKTILWAGILIIISIGAWLLSQKEEVPNDPQQTPVDTANENATPENTTTLDLSNKELTKVPEQVFTMSSLTTLNLSHNKLEGALPAEIQHLQNLRHLDLSNNNFTGVPAEIGQLKKLETLNLSDNALTGLPNEMANLSNLQTLNLQGNKYSVSDLETIKKGLSDSVEILTD